jgi:hypothetical protein
MPASTSNKSWTFLTTLGAFLLDDEIVSFKNKRPGGHRINLYHGKTLRRVTVARPDKDAPINQGCLFP